MTSCEGRCCANPGVGVLTPIEGVAMCHRRHGLRGRASQWGEAFEQGYVHVQLGDLSLKRSSHHPLC